jgi:hypothetical protein
MKLALNNIGRKNIKSDMAIPANQMASWLKADNFLLSRDGKFLPYKKINRIKTGKRNRVNSLMENESPKKIPDSSKKLFFLKSVHLIMAQPDITAMDREGVPSIIAMEYWIKR